MLGWLLAGLVFVHYAVSQDRLVWLVKQYSVALPPEEEHCRDLASNPKAETHFVQCDRSVTSIFLLIIRKIYGPLYDCPVIWH
jgi:hypothetical protein